MNILERIQKIISWLIYNKYIVWYLFGMAFLIRIVLAIIQYNNACYLNFSDDLAYYELGENVIEQGVFVKDISKLGLTASVIGPVIGWVLGLTFFIFGANWLPVFLVSALISSLVTFFIYKLGEMLFGNEVAFLAALWSVFYIFFLKSVSTCGKDLWMTFLFLLVIYLSFKCTGKQYFNKRIIYLSIVFFLLTHLDERFFLFGPLIFLFVIIVNSHSPKAGILKGITFVLLSFAIATPWLIRNYQVYDKIVISSVRISKYTDKVFNYDHVEPFESHEKRWYISPEQIDSICNGTLKPDANGKIILDNLKNKNRQIIVSGQQIDALKKGYLPTNFSRWQTMCASFINFWQPIDLSYGYFLDGYRFDGKNSLRHNLSSGLTYGLLLPFFIIGLVLLIIRKPLIGWTFLVIIISYTFLHVVFIPFTNGRYRIPLDPIIILCSMYGVNYVYKRLGNSRWKKWPFLKQETLVSSQV